MKTSEPSKDIAAALYALQVKLKNPVKDASGAVRGGKAIPYLSLTGLLDHVRAALEETAVAVVQEVTAEANGAGITTRFVHNGGQWIEFGPTVVPHGADAQAVGSAISYGRRYALLAAFGLAAEDDDGQRASVKLEPAARPSAGSPEGGGMGDTDGSGAPASDPTSGESPAYGEGAGGSLLLITDEQIEVLKKAAGGVQKARAASKATYSKDWRELTADEALKLIQQLQKVKEDAA